MQRSIASIRLQQASYFLYQSWGPILYRAHNSDRRWLQSCTACRKSRRSLSSIIIRALHGQSPWNNNHLSCRRGRSYPIRSALSCRQQVIRPHVIVPSRRQAHLQSGPKQQNICTAASSGFSRVMSGNGAAACPNEFIEAAIELADVAADITTQYFRFYGPHYPAIYHSACHATTVPG